MNFPLSQVKGHKYKSLLEQRIREAAELKPIEISKLAADADMSTSTLYKMFKAGSTKASTLEKLAKVLEIDAKDLIQNFQETSNILAFDEDEIRPGKILSVEKTKLFLSELPDKDAEQYVPYYDVEITAGKPGIEIYFDDSEERPDGYVYAPHYPGCIMCNVKGNSMYDLIYPGARLYVYKMEDLKYIDFGQIYVIVTKSLRVLKYIKRHPDNALVRLVPHNNPEEYWDVEKADIVHLFLVKGFENQTAM